MEVQARVHSILRLNAVQCSGRKGRSSWTCTLAVHLCSCMHPRRRAPILSSAPVSASQVLVQPVWLPMGARGKTVCTPQGNQLFPGAVLGLEEQKLYPSLQHTACDITYRWSWAGWRTGAQRTFSHLEKHAARELKSAVHRAQRKQL